ncbi:hypothetical protein WJX72_010664 [[Myrmecia] bisecta]|uniref:Protein kinase domain-containing protein n=1 Tax=[Myrmecia] bisecta TaxID=41462 RepID=A0AAW1PA40_9CHLO
MGCSASTLATLAHASSFIPQATMSHRSSGYMHRSVDKKRLPYTGAHEPWNEAERLAALTKLCLADLTPDPQLDEICHALAQVFKVAFAQIAFLEKSELKIVAKQNGNERVATVASACPRHLGICAYTLLPDHPEMLVVPDLCYDARFADHPMVFGDPYLRFYAGCPLTLTSGMRIGTLCVLDTQPRPDFDAACCALLGNFAEIVVRVCESLVLKAATSQHPAPSLSTDPSGMAIPYPGVDDRGILLIDTQRQGWPVQFANQWMLDLVNLGAQAVVGRPLEELCWMDMLSSKGMHGSSTKADMEALLGRAAEFSTTAGLTKMGAPSDVANLQFRAATEPLDQSTVVVGIPPHVLPSPPSDNGRYYFVTITVNSPVAGQEQVEGQAAPATGLISDVCPASPSSPSTNSFRNGSLNFVERVLVRSPSVLAAQDKPAHPRDLVVRGPCIGRTAKSMLYRAMMRTTQKPVTIKIMETRVPPGVSWKVAAEDAQSIPSLRQLPHPNIVQTFQHATKARQTGRSVLRRYTFRRLLPANDSGRKSTDGKIHRTKSSTMSRINSMSGLPSVIETWLLQEDCDRGTLKDACEAGCFMKTKSLYLPVPSIDLLCLLLTAQEIASALAFLHDKGIVHGDLTPSNVLLHSSRIDKRGFVAKVSGLDLSRNVDAGEAELEELSNETRPPGSLAYTAPELLVDIFQTSQAGDVYSFGVLLWFMWMAVQPMRPNASSPLPLPCPAGMPAMHKAVIQACTAKSPADRPTSAQLLLILQEGLAGAVGIPTAVIQSPELAKVNSEPSEGPVRMHTSTSTERIPLPVESPLVSYKSLQEHEVKGAAGATRAMAASAAVSNGQMNPPATRVSGIELAVAAG